MKQSIQAMFYACDYSTKPNMTCAPLLVAVRDGIRRLEERLRVEEEAAAEAPKPLARGPALTKVGGRWEFCRIPRGGALRVPSEV